MTYLRERVGKRMKERESERERKREQLKSVWLRGFRVDNRK